MNGRDLIYELLKHDLNAEVMISAPLEADQGHPGLTGDLTLPTCGVDSGFFQSGAVEGMPWVSILGAEVWRMQPLTTAQILAAQEARRVARLPSRPLVSDPNVCCGRAKAKGEGERCSECPERADRHAPHQAVASSERSSSSHRKYIVAEGLKLAENIELLAECRRRGLLPVGV